MRSASIVLVLSLTLAATGAAAAAEMLARADTGASGTGESAVVTLTVPLFSPRFEKVPVATVNDDPVTMQELIKVLSMAHEGREGATATGKLNYARALKRLITTKLVIQEARSMGLDELPEVKELFDTYAKRTLRDLLRQSMVKDVVADEAEAEQQYRQAIKEYLIRSVLFKSEKDAQAMADAAAAGQQYAELADAALADGSAQGSREAETVKAADVNPDIAGVLEGAGPGAVRGPVGVGSGYVVLRIEDVRYVENAETKQQVKQDLLNREQTKVLIEENKKLSRKYLVFHEKLIKSVDFGSEKTGMEVLRKDRRALVRVKGDKPIAVADLAAAMEEKLYHGSKNINSKKLNRQKAQVIEELAGKRVFLLEAMRQGLDKTEEYRNSIREYEQSILFSMFVQMVVAPSVQPADDELRAYYDAHTSEYALAPVVRLDSLAFLRKSDAEAALDKARKGTELRWLRENLSGQADENDPDALRFDGSDLAADSLPAKMAEALAGARSGDVRLAEDGPKYVYVLFVRDAGPARTIPFEQAKERLSKKVFEEKLLKALDEWVDKLKGGSDVKIYLATNDK